MKEDIIRELDESIRVKSMLKGQAELIASIAKDAVKVLKNHGKIVLFGNGGSAADAQHIAAELIGRFRRSRSPIPALALTTDTSALTAISNDLSFKEVFARQMEALLGKNDLAIAISTSGRSKNILRGVEVAKRIGAKTVGLTGGDGGELAKIVDRALIVPSYDTQRIQESHITVCHILCRIIEEEKR